jgi:UDPglucose 6-dehydrogenase
VNKLNKIGIIGYGVVGRAIAHGFKLNRNLVYINDIKPNIENFSKKNLMALCDYIFICVPTPENNGKIDLSFITGVLKELSKYKGNPIIIIKSTIVPGTTHKLEQIFPFKFAVNPEFLRQEKAEKDFMDPSRIVIGASDRQVGKKVLTLFEKWKCPKILTDPITAETIKYISNAFLTYKVAFACEVAHISKIIGVDAKEVMDVVCMDARINSSHLDPTLGPISIDSPCLPKDLISLITYLENKSYSSEL